MLLLYKNKKFKKFKKFKPFILLLTLLTLVCSISVTSRSSAKSAEDVTDLAKEAKYLANIKQLTFEGEKSGEAYFSPDGKSIIFQSVRDESGYYRIYSMNLDGSNLKLISPNNGKTTCSYFSPDSKRLIYASTHLNPSSVEEKKPESKTRYQWDFDPSFDIFAADLDGSNLMRLTDTPGYDAEGSYSHDGTKIVFTSQRDGDLEIYTMNADGSGQRRITQAKGYDGGPFFSPDDTQVVFRGFRSEDGSAQIFLINADGSNERQLTNTKAINWCPYFYPDGKRMVYASNLDGGRNFELFLMNIDGTGLVRITYNESFDALPVFSPDGGKLMWTSTRNGGKSQIFIADFIDPDSYSHSEGSGRRSEKVLRTSDITSDELKKHVYYLASDELEGRMTGTVGAEKAAKYIAEEYGKYGLQPVGDRDSYYQNFEFISGVKLGAKNSLRLVLKDQKEQALDYHPEGDFLPLVFSSEGRFEGDVAFAGYGIAAPEIGYDDYSGIDVSGKVVLVLRYTPEGDNPHSKFYKYAPLRYKALTAREKGAKALLIVTGPLSDKEDILIPLKHDNSFSDSGIFVYNVSRKVANAILQPTGRNIEELQNRIDSTKQSDSFQIEPTRIVGSVDLIKEKPETSNVVGYLPPGLSGKSAEILIIGAHYDHLGRGTEASLASKLGEIHNGADDNASGVAGLLELAEAFSAIRGNLVRGVLFIAFSGEEIGVLGSNYYTKHPIFPLEKAVCMINMDMIGRLRDNKLAISGIATSSAWKEMVLKYNQIFKFDLSLKDDGYGPSDHSMFYAKGIPILFFFTGSHEDYHKPSDDADKINYDGERRVVRLILALAKAINNIDKRPDFVNVPHSEEAETATRGFRVYMGTIPDYLEQVEGVKLSGVRKGSPAAKAGIQAGDLIVGFGEKTIKNIYDYTYALQEHKPGETVTVTVLRANKEIKFQVTLGRRE